MLRWRSLLARMAARFNGALGPAAGFSPSAVLWCHGAGLQVSETCFTSSQRRHQQCNELTGTFGATGSTGGCSFSAMPNIADF